MEGQGRRAGRNLRTEPRVAPASHGWGGMEGLSLRKGLHTNGVRSRGMWYPRGKKKKMCFLESTVHDVEQR